MASGKLGAMPTTEIIAALACEVPQCDRPPNSGGRFCNHDHAKLVREGVPCEGGCGHLMWGYTRRIRPDGKWATRTTGICRACRITRRAEITAAAAYTAAPRTCTCGVVFWPRQRSQIWCTPPCRRRHGYQARDAARTDRWRNKSGHAWRVMRARVRAEEFWCWRCWEPIDPARVFPDPWCFTLDHVRSLIEGGEDMDRDNIRAAHLRCNVAAGAAQYRRRLRAVA